MLKKIVLLIVSLNCVSASGLFEDTFTCKRQLEGVRKLSGNLLLENATLRTKIATSACRETVESLKKLKERQELLQKDLLKVLNRHKNPGRFSLVWYGAEYHQEIYARFLDCALNPHSCNFTEQEMSSAPENVRNLVEKIHAISLAQEECNKIGQQIEAQNNQIQKIADNAVKQGK